MEAKYHFQKFLNGALPKNSPPGVSLSRVVAYDPKSNNKDLDSIGGFLFNNGVSLVLATDDDRLFHVTKTSPREGTPHYRLTDGFYANRDAELAPKGKLAEKVSELVNGYRCH